MICSVNIQKQGPHAPVTRESQLHIIHISLMPTPSLKPYYWLPREQFIVIQPVPEFYNSLIYSLISHCSYCLYQIKEYVPLDNASLSNRYFWLVKFDDQNYYRLLKAEKAERKREKKRQFKKNMQNKSTDEKAAR